MELATWQIAILIIFSFFCILDNLTLVIGMQFPVIVGTIAGLIVGDVTLGLTIGATLQLMVPFRISRPGRSLVQPLRISLVKGSSLH